MHGSQISSLCLTENTEIFQIENYAPRRISLSPLQPGVDIPIRQLYEPANIPALAHKHCYGAVSAFDQGVRDHTALSWEHWGQDMEPGQECSGVPYHQAVHREAKEDKRPLNFKITFLSWYGNLNTKHASNNTLNCSCVKHFSSSELCTHDHRGKARQAPTEGGRPHRPCAERQVQGWGWDYRGQWMLYHISWPVVYSGMYIWRNKNRVWTFFLGVPAEASSGQHSVCDRKKHVGGLWHPCTVAVLQCARQKGAKRRFVSLILHNVIMSKCLKLAFNMFSEAADMDSDFNTFWCLFLVYVDRSLLKYDENANTDDVNYWLREVLKQQPRKEGGSNIRYIA